MTARFVQKGDAIDFVPTADVAAGDVLVLGDLVAVAKLDIKTGELGSLHVSGIFDFGKATGAGSAIPVGSLVYYDEAEKVAKTDAEAGANKLIGKVIADAGDDDPTVRVRLSQ